MRGRTSLATASAAALLLSSGVAVAAPGTDFSLTMQGPATAATGEAFSYAISISHTGRGKSATSLTDSVPAQLTVQGVTATAATCSTTGNDVSCTTAKLALGEVATVSITVTTTQSGTVTNTATLAPDADAANNSASVETDVTAAPTPPAGDDPAQGTVTPPYDGAGSSSSDHHAFFAYANAETGEVELSMHDCRFNVFQQRGTCSGMYAHVHQAMLAPGSGLRRVLVTATVHVASASVPPHEPTAGIALEMDVTAPGVQRSCSQPLVGAGAGRFSMHDTTVVLNCDLLLIEPETVLTVETGVSGGATLTWWGGVEAVVSSITASP